MIKAGGNKMKYKTAPKSMAIKVITAIIILMTLGFLLGGIFEPGLLIGGVLLAITVILCYLWAPKEYEVTENNLKVIYNWGSKEFTGISKVEVVTEKLGFGVRLFGNGGVFCGSGIFWCKKIGIFRAYVTSARLKDYVMLETRNHKVMISPENRDQFVLDARGVSLELSTDGSDKN